MTYARFAAEQIVAGLIALFALVWPAVCLLDEVLQWWCDWLCRSMFGSPSDWADRLYGVYPGESVRRPKATHDWDDDHRVARLPFCEPEMGEEA